MVTVGYIHAGTKNNIIPDQAELGLTVRTYTTDVRKQVLAAITRIANAEAAAAAAPRPPAIEHYEATDAVYNDPALAQRMRGALAGGARRRQRPQRRADHGLGGLLGVRRAGHPGVLSQSRRRRPGQVRRGAEAGHALPSNHSALFAPDVDPALHTAIGAELAMLRELLRADAAPPARH